MFNNIRKKIIEELRVEEAEPIKELVKEYPR